MAYKPTEEYPVPPGGTPGLCNMKTLPSNEVNELCKQPAGWKTKHPGIGPCRHHGGLLPGHSLKAQKILIRRAMTTYGEAVVGITPEEALMNELERTFGAVIWLQGVIRQLNPEALVWGMKTAKKLGYRQLSEDPDMEVELMVDLGRDLYEITFEAGTNAWLKIYMEERKHLTEIATKAIKLGLDERRVTLAERQGGQLRVVLAKVFDQLQLTDDQRRAVPSIMAGVLADFTGGQVINGQLVPAKALG